jgi:hypothetical protein
MMYQTIVLESRKKHPKIRGRLRRHHMPLPKLERCASELKASHQDLKDSLPLANPESVPSQIASLALEIALQELEACLLSWPHSQDCEPPFAEGKMVFIHRPTRRS